MKLSVIIPNRNDTVMLSITVRSVLEAFKAINDDGEIIIVDNSDADLYRLITKPSSTPLAWHYVKEGKIRVIRQEKPGMFPARMTGAREAKGEYLFQIDSHMLIGHNTFKDLIDFMDTAEKKIGLAYAPIGWCGQHETVARHDIRTDMDSIYASWGKRYYEPRKICWNFGSCLSRREWFLNVLDGYGFFEKKNLSWGGGEFYVSVKSWLLGYENWAVPTNPIYHIGMFSADVARLTGYKYRVYSSSGDTKPGIGILSAFYVLGGDQEGRQEALKAEAGITKHHGLTVEKNWEEAKSLAFEDRQWFKSKQVITLKEFWEKRIWENTP